MDHSQKSLAITLHFSIKLITKLKAELCFSTSNFTISKKNLYYHQNSDMLLGI